MEYKNKERQQKLDNSEKLRQEALEKKVEALK